MKQVVLSYRSRDVSIKTVPVPRCESKGVLVKTEASLISIGTESLIIDLGKKTLISKAAARPDLVRRALAKAKNEGFINVWNQALDRLDIPTPLGYSSSGLVVESGLEAAEFSIGDRVACIGQGYASHAEYVAMPTNLVCKIPNNLSSLEASFGMLGIIALHSVRNANLTFGSKVSVIGTGLLGLLTAQILKAYGCEVILFDPAEEKIKLAKRLGFVEAYSRSEDFFASTSHGRNSQGYDAVIITASSKDKKIVDDAIKISRPRGRVVIVGISQIEPDRNLLWEKEVEIIVSKAGGPGSLDPLYELGGIEKPIQEVRWTIKRNLEEFLRLVSAGLIDVKSLITMTVDIENAENIYQKISNGEMRDQIGMIFTYQNTGAIQRRLEVQYRHKISKYPLQGINIGVVGAGVFGKSILLPVIQKSKKFTFDTLVTSSSVSVENSAAKFNFKNQSTDESVLWDDAEIDAIIYLTKHKFHGKAVLNSITKNKPLFLEKPLCISEKELEDIKQALQSAHELPLIMIGHNRRFSPHSVKIKEWLSFRLSPAIITIRVNAGYVKSSHWVHHGDEGRSRIIGEMTHFIDLMQYLLNKNIISVTAERVSGDNEVIVNNDNIIAAFKFVDGSIGNLVYTGCGDRSYGRELIEIFFDGKTIISNDYKLSAHHREGKIERYCTRNQNLGYESEINYFADALIGKERTVIGIEENVRIMEIAFAIEKSLSMGKKIIL